MSARKRRVYCDGCGRCGGGYGPAFNATQLAALRRQLATEGWTRPRLRWLRNCANIGDHCPDCSAVTR